MLLQPVGNQDPKERFHVPSGIGKAMVRAGVAEEYLDYSAVIANTTPPVRWTVDREANGRPVIHAICDKCGHHGQEGNKVFMSVEGLAHKEVFHCLHWHEAPPREIVHSYLREWKQWSRNTTTEKKPFYAPR